MPAKDAVRIRDPIHGTIVLSPAELRVVETPIYQRLRRIKQLGFAEYAFPGATHTRFAHGLGAMEMASRMFDAIFPLEDGPLAHRPRRRMRQIVRLAVLLHDIGHAPLSHATEACMPARTDLCLDDSFDDLYAHPRSQATHEDYTIKLLLQSELTEVVERTFGAEGIAPLDIARLIGGQFARRPDVFVVDGADYAPILRQLVSGELDADRMDYLQRDSYYAGVNYGKFDEQWLLNNLTYHGVDQRVFMALSHRAIFAFEDFLLSRYHMFVSVYYHHTAVGFDTMLARFIDEAPEVLRLPSDVDAYIQLDDVSFWSALRESPNEWAARIVGRRLYRRLVELNADQESLELSDLTGALQRGNIDYFVSRDEGVLSRYFHGTHLDPIYVINHALGQATRIDNYSKLFQRYAQPARLTRVYCRPDQASVARTMLESLLPRQLEL